MSLNDIAEEIVDKLFKYRLPDLIRVRRDYMSGDITEQEEAELEHKIYYEIHKKCHEFIREKNGRRPR